MKRIFISYRREDSAVFTGRLYDRLTREFGTSSVFLDIDSIPTGASDFRRVVREHIQRAGVVLAVIGRGWTGTKGSQRRIDDRNDPVRVELQDALEVHKPIIPIYSDMAEPLTPDQWPSDLSAVAWMNAVFIETGPDFDQQVRRLTRDVERLLLPSQLARLSRRLLRWAARSRSWLLGLAVVAMLALVNWDWIAATTMSGRGLVDVLVSRDPLVFKGATAESCDLVRGFRDRADLVRNTDLPSSIAGAKQTFDLFALSAAAFYSNPESVRAALANGVHFRIVLADPSEANRGHIESYFEVCGQGGNGAQWQMDSTVAGIKVFRSIDNESRLKGGGRIEVRTWKGPFLNGLWVRDGRRTDGVAHLEVSSYGRADLHPSMRSGLLGAGFRQSLQAQFDHIWERSHGAQ